jgi:ComF family protein
VWRWLFTLLDGLYPPRCVAHDCGRRGAWLCPRCVAGIVPVPEPSCARCGAPLARGRPCHDCTLIRPCFARAVAVGAYETPLREAVQALKYRGATALAEPLGGLVASRLVGQPVDLVVPVPAHRRRVRGRGVDHARMLAEAVARTLGVPADGSTLVRTRATRPQVGLAPEARRDNVALAFAARRPVTAANIVLVDDVLTTGATASACAAVLLAAGGARVVVATVARATNVRPHLGRHGEGHV